MILAWLYYTSGPVRMVEMLEVLHEQAATERLLHRHNVSEGDVR